MIARGQQEILDRIKACAAGEADFFGFRREVLVIGLDYPHAKAADYPADGVTEAQWNMARNAMETDARGYLDFAISKILGHRGISASRSVDKLGEWAWLFGRDDVVEAMAVAEWGNYGAGKVKAFADGMGWPFEAGNASQDAMLARMIDGEPCVPGCESGCGR